nr:MAG TPA: hypothetical protein [Caudoviricetes sp.]
MEIPASIFSSLSTAISLRSAITCPVTGTK